jgi:hypothetical protein
MQSASVICGPSYQRNTYLLVLGLLESRLVVLGSGTHELLLHVVDACHHVKHTRIDNEAIE